MKALLFCLLLITLVTLATSKRIHTWKNFEDSWVKEASPTQESQDVIDEHTEGLNKFAGTEGSWTVTDEWTNIMGRTITKHVWISNGSKQLTVGFVHIDGYEGWIVSGALEGHQDHIHGGQYRPFSK